MKNVVPDRIESVHKLIQLAQEGSHCRQKALKMLGNNFPPKLFVEDKYPLKEVIEVLKQAAFSNNANIATEGLCQLSFVDKEIAYNCALARINDNVTKIRCEAIDVLGSCERGQSVSLLKDFSSNEKDIDVLIECYLALIHLGKFEYIDKLMVTFQQSDDVNAEYICDGLYIFSDTLNFDNYTDFFLKRKALTNSKKLTESIQDLLDGIEYEKQSILIEGLDIEIDSNIKELFTLLKSNVNFVRSKAMGRFGGGHKPNKYLMPKHPPENWVFEELKQHITDEFEDVRANLMNVLGDWKRKEDVDFIASQINDPSELVRIDAIYALGQIGDIKAIPILEKKLNKDITKLEKVRLYQALICLGCEEYLDPWLDYLESPNTLCRSNVAGGIWTVASPKKVEKLHRKLLKALGKEEIKAVFLEIKEAIEQLDKIKQ